MNSRQRRQAERRGDFTRLDHKPFFWRWECQTCGTGGSINRREIARAVQLAHDSGQHDTFSTAERFGDER